PKAIEEYFEELRLYCYNQVLDLTGNPELSDDISQDSLSALLQSQREIKYVKGWLSKTTINKVYQHSKQCSRNHDIAKRALELHTEYEDPNDVSEDSILKKVTPPHARKLLSKKDYMMYKQIMAHKTLKDYAKSAGISYQTAREHSLIIRTNLKAAYFRSKGWDDGIDILDYRLLVKLKKTLHKLIDIYGRKIGAPLPYSAVRISADQMYEYFLDVLKIEDWGISKMTDTEFNALVCDADPDKFIVLKLFFKKNKANHLTLISCERTVPEGLMRVPPELVDHIDRMQKERTLPQTQEEFEKLISDFGYESTFGTCLRDFEDAPEKDS
ncbi:MAG: hypothetical protein U1C33_03450, partial [Candidatus Cloacimonadaceae bacterium]|nr:hypothetical protein [Candidatus Cloacimonadaceae bacterium]